MKSGEFFRGSLLCLLLLAVPVCEGNVYCLIAKTHSLCTTHDTGKQCGPNFQQKIPSKDDIQIILSWHNQIRQNVALGKETKTPEPLPQAANMMKMEWDDELTKIAQAHANLCVFEHDCKKCREVKGDRFSVGQNIGLGVYSGNSTLPTEIDWTRIMDGWYNGEVQMFKKSYVNKFVFGQWGHFSQVIWWNSRLVGCGASIHMKDQSSYHIIVCNYGRSGNLEGTEVYKTGPPCSDCPKETQCDATYNGLCAPTKNVSATESFPTDDLYIYSGETVSEKNVTSPKLL